MNEPPLTPEQEAVLLNVALAYANRLITQDQAATAAGGLLATWQEGAE